MCVRTINADPRGIIGSFVPSTSSIGTLRSFGLSRCVLYRINECTSRIFIAILRINRGIRKGDGCSTIPCKNFCSLPPEPNEAHADLQRTLYIGCSQWIPEYPAICKSVCLYPYYDILCEK